MIGTKTITKANGDVQTIVGDMIQHRRLLVDTRKWALSKALPKIYGDKREVDNKHTIVEGRSAALRSSSTRKGRQKGRGTGAWRTLLPIRVPHSCAALPFQRSLI